LVTVQLAVIVGATGGIGAALLNRLNRDERFDRVLGVSRSGSPALDLTDEGSIAACAAHISALGGELRLVIDATGALTLDGAAPEKSLRQLDAARLAAQFAVNAIGPALLMKHLLPLLPKQGRSVFATLSARVGSIGDNHLGGWYGYRASKAALNQFVRTASIELARTRPEAVCVALHPGTVATRLSRPFVDGGPNVLSPDEAAKRLLEVIAGLSASDSGAFFDYDGRPIVW
jgi:NAD(P)-dependent dehydrogenase (short-subunit alcohol dehydrogenase family)